MRVRNKTTDMTDWYLDTMSASLTSFLALSKADLSELCEQRGLELDGNKKLLVERLIHWVHKFNTHNHLDGGVESARKTTSGPAVCDLDARFE